MTDHTATELQRLADCMDEPGEVEYAVLAALEGERPLSLAGVANRVDRPREEVEDALRRLLERQEVGETADWRFYRAVTPSNSP